jgi:hypothetical protein
VGAAQSKLRLKDRAHVELERTHVELERTAAAGREEAHEHKRRLAAMEHELRDTKARL